MNTERQDIYTRITAKIIALLEQGVRPWMRPWSGDNPAARISRPLRHNGTPYSGINILMLWGASVEHGFTSPSWMTFRQALALNAHVRKGENREIPFLKGYTVFNVEQIEGLPEHYYAKPEPRFTHVQRINHADAFFAATQADIRYRGGRAYYAQEADYIQLPPIESFRDAESFYAILAHESIHRTKHPSRLNRDFGRKVWGDEGYAREELVAELGAAFLCATLEITPEVQEDHASYIATWLQKWRARHFFSNHQQKIMRRNVALTLEEVFRAIGHDR